MKETRQAFVATGPGIALCALPGSVTFKRASTLGGCSSRSIFEQWLMDRVLWFGMLLMLLLPLLSTCVQRGVHSWPGLRKQRLVRKAKYILASLIQCVQWGSDLCVRTAINQ
jgi:hypothetical protein